MVGGVMMSCYWGRRLLCIRACFLELRLWSLQTIDVTIDVQYLSICLFNFWIWKKLFLPIFIHIGKHQTIFLLLYQYYHQKTFQISLTTIMDLIMNWNPVRTIRRLAAGKFILILLGARPSLEIKHVTHQHTHSSLLT